jgi:multidrug efflux pump
VLTALAAILAMIPLSESLFWGPMAVTIMAGLFVATFLTLLFVPALYALWNRKALTAESLAGVTRRGLSAVIVSEMPMAAE